LITFEQLNERMKTFEIPTFYRSAIIGRVKGWRKLQDPRKRDFSPTVLDFGNVTFILPRHFGFCYGVENAIEIAYRALQENDGKRIFLLSEMIHNPAVNADLLDRGVRFLMNTKGEQLIGFDTLTAEDIVIIPAFGTTLEIESVLAERGVEVAKYNTTCPFVEKVWNRSSKLGDEQYTTIIHGKPDHEETRATFSHAQSTGSALVVSDMFETEILAEFISGQRDLKTFETQFAGRFSSGFRPDADLSRIGVVNQTTMLATETQAIADYLKRAMIDRYGEAHIAAHFADTRDTLCYATNDNQQATLALFADPAELAIVIGGYNSSNTTHLVELCEGKMPTLFIQSEEDLLSAGQIRSFNIHTKQISTTELILPKAENPRIVITSGASCPDAIVDRVLQRLLSFYPGARSIEEVLRSLGL
jgi:4-hydroxy-3-methylbut-2-enyl diphosphate reductase